MMKWISTTERPSKHCKWDIFYDKINLQSLEEREDAVNLPPDAATQIVKNSLVDDINCILESSFIYLSVGSLLKTKFDV